ncbi:MAG TPA: hypothetical protein VF059_13215 [Casimicrobiaceae bacterium]
MRTWVVIGLSLLLAACASAPIPERPGALFDDALFAAPSQRISAADVFALSPEMRQYLATDIARLVRADGSQRGLYEALYTRGGLTLEYDAAITRNASQAFAARTGNCLSLVIMTAAFAKEMGMTVRFQHVFTDETIGRSGDFYLSIGHVNVALRNMRNNAGIIQYDVDSMTIDFLPPPDLRGLRFWVIDESTIVAMYMNNRAVESLVSGNVNDAYWWAREAIVQDPRFLSAYNTLGIVYQRHRNLPQAQRALEYVLAHEPANTTAMSNLVSVLNDRGQLVAASKLRDELARIEPNPPFAYFKRGLAAMQERNYKLAKEMFSKEVDRAAYYHEFHFWLAMANAGLGEMDQARAQMTIALENSTTRADHDLYAAKLERLRSYTPVIRR